MGFGAIVILVMLAGMSIFKSAQFIEENEMTGVAAEALLFVINVGLLVWGNHWAWAGWQLTALSKVVFFPSDEVIERMERSKKDTRAQKAVDQGKSPGWRCPSIVAGIPCASPARLAHPC